MEGGKLEQPQAQIIYTRPPKRGKTRSFPWEYVEGARCDE